MSKKSYIYTICLSNLFWEYIWIRVIGHDRKFAVFCKLLFLKAPRIILLKEGTDTSQGVPQIVSNINACQAVADAVRTTLGPRGMDKLILDQNNSATISNDGATILKLLDVVHPAAKSLVDISRSQDAEVGDGTTSVTLLAAELLRQVKPYIEEGVHPSVINRAFREGAKLALGKLNSLACRVEKNAPK